MIQNAIYIRRATWEHHQKSTKNTTQIFQMSSKSSCNWRIMPSKDMVTSMASMRKETFYLWSSCLTILRSCRSERTIRRSICTINSKQAWSKLYAILSSRPKVSSPNRTTPLNFLDLTSSLMSCSILFWSRLTLIRALKRATNCSRSCFQEWLMIFWMLWVIQFLITLICMEIFLTPLGRTTLITVHDQDIKIATTNHNTIYRVNYSEKAIQVIRRRIICGNIYVHGSEKCSEILNQIN